MPFVLTTSDRVMFAQIYGVFTVAELDRLASEVESAEAAHPVSLDRLTDITGVERFEVGIREIYYFAVRRSAQKFSRVVKSAIVVEDAEQFRQASLYAALNENPQVQIRILQKTAGAREWFAQASAESIQ